MYNFSYFAPKKESPELRFSLCNLCNLRLFFLMLNYSHISFNNDYINIACVPFLNFFWKKKKIQIYKYR